MNIILFVRIMGVKNKLMRFVIFVKHHLSFLNLRERYLGPSMRH